MYRLLHANEINSFRPQLKIHIMCNDPPLVDGIDHGIKRRIRKIDYVSQFVHPDQANESLHYDPRDDKFMTSIRDKNAFRMEFLRFLLGNYDHNYMYEMPKVMEDSSHMYLEENNSVSTPYALISPLVSLV